MQNVPPMGIRNWLAIMGSCVAGGATSDHVRLSYSRSGAQSSTLCLWTGKAYDMTRIIEAIVDENTFEEYKKDYGKTIVCGLARVDGWAIGIVANQREVVKQKKQKEDLSKMADGRIVTGFMVEPISEQWWIIKDGANGKAQWLIRFVPKFYFYDWQTVMEL
ncbi:hypothetical protein FQR65_LT19931 [Abscondita terminalis]|nr:hypothetical protein FQR65_LT19931 [Abscondita terminalis]